MANERGGGYASLIHFYTFPRFDKSVPFNSQMLTDRGLWTLDFGWGVSGLQRDTGDVSES